MTATNTNGYEEIISNIVDGVEISVSVKDTDYRISAKIDDCQIVTYVDLAEVAKPCTVLVQEMQRAKRDVVAEAAKL